MVINKDRKTLKTHWMYLYKIVCKYKQLSKRRYILKSHVSVCVQLLLFFYKKIILKFQLIHETLREFFFNN